MLISKSFWGLLVLRRPASQHKHWLFSRNETKRKICHLERELLGKKISFRFDRDSGSHIIIIIIIIIIITLSAATATLDSSLQQHNKPADCQVPSTAPTNTHTHAHSLHRCQNQRKQSETSASRATFKEQSRQHQPGRLKCLSTRATPLD